MLNVFCCILWRAEEFRKAGLSMVIWANHNLRAAITAMRDVSARIMESESLMQIEGSVSSVREVFDLVGNEELIEAEKRYLTRRRQSVRAIVLAASRGEEFGMLTRARPKCMLDVRGQPLLRRLVSTLNEVGVRDLTVVRGFAKEAIDLPAIRTVDNEDYATAGEAASLAKALDRIEGDCLIAYGDTLFRRYIADNVLESDGDIVLVADALWRERAARRAEPGEDFVVCSQPFSGAYLEEEPALLQAIGRELEPSRIDGEWIGLVRLSAAGAAALAATLRAMAEDQSLAKASLPDLFRRMLEAGHEIRVNYITGHWLNVNDAFDLASARNFL